MTYETTKHFETRFRQRGYQTGDLELVLEYGTPRPDGVLLRKKDVDRAISELKLEIESLQRLSHTYIPVDEGKAITIQRARPWKQRGVLRGRKRRTG